MSGYGHAKRDEWKEGIGKDIHPTKAFACLRVSRHEVQGQIKELIDAEPGNTTEAEGARRQMLPADVIVALEGGNTPAERTFRNQDAGWAVMDAYVLSNQRSVLN